MVYLIESFTKVQKNGISLFFISKGARKIVYCNNQLGDGATFFSEAMLCIVQNVILFKVGHKIAKHNMF